MLNKSLFLLFLTFIVLSCSGGPEAPIEAVSDEEVSEDLESEENSTLKETPFVKLLRKSPSKSVSWKSKIVNANLKKSKNGFKFTIALVQCEACDEKYRGFYRKDGTLKYVFQTLHQISHSKGSKNSDYLGKLVRQFTPKGDLESVTGFLSEKNLITKEKTVTRIKKLDDEGVKLFELNLPPLKLTPEVMQSAE